MLSRQLEPELMDDPQEAIAYDEMDHAQVNERFVEDLLCGGAIGTDVLDLGTGTARIPIELCNRNKSCRVFASDGAISMLEIARYNVSVASLDDRIQLHHGDAKQLEFEDEMFDTVVSNSLIHHLPEPALAIKEIIRVTKPSGRIFVRDLCRPTTDGEVDSLVELYAAGVPEAARKMFRESLYAALTLEEIQSLIAAHRFASSEVSMTSDRHWTWSSTKEASPE